MSEFAFFRFMSLNLLMLKKKENKNETISVTEQVLDEEGIQCDSKIAKLKLQSQDCKAKLKKRLSRFFPSSKATTQEYSK